MPDEVYVELLDEGVRVWRPVPARRLSVNVYEIIKDGTPYDPTIERWMFPPGARVSCVLRQLSGREVLVAVALADEMTLNAFIR